MKQLFLVLLIGLISLTSFGQINHQIENGTAIDSFRVLVPTKFNQLQS